MTISGDGALAVPLGAMPLARGLGRCALMQWHSLAPQMRFLVGVLLLVCATPPCVLALEKKTEALQGTDFRYDFEFLKRTH